MENILQIVKLKRMMRRWKALLRRSSDASSQPTRAGYAAVYVGSDRIRFEIPARYLNLPVIVGLLEKAEEEFGGAQPAGGLSLPCEPGFFRWVLDMLGRDEPRLSGLGLEAFFRLFADLPSAGDCSASVTGIRRSQSLPLHQSSSV